ncbi:MAG: copper resistance protein B [Gammaproteobacteria bacterium]|nr:copper resistance protein B [Rhodocyclaceae bacterium]MBU3909682.1 copper resistance protein B [Gammaproteobacteria bacterium]MBU3988032.1 copper resistance protein B [Gammaproteobacteria bacterium]MBU4005215.1 copper resistance protein B [Gammaproteobacteria bacterium]MBU4022394.1 copper resistance protein B [Gammaproteobacteria bacterium]
MNQIGISLVAALGATGVLAQTAATMPEMDHSSHNMMPGMQGGAMPAAKPATPAQPAMAPQEGSSMTGMQHGSSDKGTRSPDYSEGQDFGPLGREKMADDLNFSQFVVERLEHVRDRDKQTLTVYDARAWIGGDYNRLVVKAEGEVKSGRIQESRTELLWGHAIAPFWDTQLGIRHDDGGGPGRTWAAVGIEGLAPYWFDVEATAYLGENGRTALRLGASYEALLTQKLILQPRFEANFYGKADPANEIGSGLSSTNVSLRLRYEVSKKFAPYVGVEWSNKHRGTADFAAAAGERTRDTRLVAGVRFWF